MYRVFYNQPNKQLKIQTAKEDIHVHVCLRNKSISALKVKINISKTLITCSRYIYTRVFHNQNETSTVHVCVNINPTTHVLDYL